MLKRFRMFLELQNGNGNFEEVRKYFLNEAKECLRLSSFEANEEGIVLVGIRVKKDPESGELENIPGEVRLRHKSIYPTIVRYEERLTDSKNEVANRLIVGYSPVI